MEMLGKHRLGAEAMGDHRLCQHSHDTLTACLTQLSNEEFTQCLKMRRKSTVRPKNRRKMGHLYIQIVAGLRDS